MFPEPRRGGGRQAWRLRKIEWQAGHQISADTGLIDHREERVGFGAPRVIADQLPKILEMPPQHAGAAERCADFVEGMLRAPPGEQSAYCVTRLEAAGFGIEVGVHDL